MADDQSSPSQWEAIVDEIDYIDRADALRLIAQLAERGASGQELVEAAQTGTLGPLALELALRPPGELVPFAEAAERAGVDVDDAASVWRALGFPDPLDPPLMVRQQQLERLRILTQMAGSLLGPEAALQLARVLGSSMAQLAEAIVDAFRVKVEMPRRDQGEPHSQVVEDYVQVVQVMIPALTEAIGEVFTGHLLAVSRASWVPDAERSAVTRELAVGFADLVDYTRSTRALPPAELAAGVSRFESKAGEVVTRHRGRVVKLIGDEVMFAIGDPGSAARAAQELVDEVGRDPQMPGVRIGLAAGPVISHQGDYYGEVVNLAARLVKAADPGTVLVSESVADEASVSAEPVDLPPLKGFDAAVPAYRLTG